MTFVPERRIRAERMIAALKPGGWLLVEELVAAGHRGLGSARRARRRRWPGRRDGRSSRSLAAAAVIRSFPQELPLDLEAAGLTDVGAEGYFVPFRTDAVVRTR